MNGMASKRYYILLCAVTVYTNLKEKFMIQQVEIYHIDFRKYLFKRAEHLVYNIVISQKCRWGSADTTKVLKYLKI